MKFLRWISMALVLLGCSVAWSQDRVVYHINDSDVQALAALRNIRNQLDTEPTTKIIVVAHAKGIDFLMEGAKDKTEASMRDRCLP